MDGCTYGLAAGANSCFRVLQEKIHADDLERAMDFLDKNHDGEVNFNEFSKCVASLAKGIYKQKTGKGGKGGKGRKGKGQKGKGGKKDDDDE